MIDQGYMNLPKRFKAWITNEVQQGYDGIKAWDKGVLNISPAQPIKTRADKTLLFVPYGRGDYERTLKLWLQPPWIKVNPSNLSYLTVKLFNDKGYPLKLRKFYASTVADINDVNIDDWEFEFLVITSDHLPRNASQHKI